MFHYRLYLCWFGFLIVQLAESSVLLDDFVLVADSAAGVIYQTDREGTDLYPLPLNLTQQTPVSLDYDPSEETVYWTDITTHTVRSAKLDGTDHRILVQLTERSTPEGIAVDPVAGLVFYTDQGLHTISVVKVDGSEGRTLVTDVPRPRAIRLDPVQRLLYWTDWGRNTIETANYDGTSRRVLSQTSQSWINSLDLDINSRQVYWVDALTNQILVTGMDDGTPQILLDVNVTVVSGYNGTDSPHLYGIALDDQYIYFTDWQRSGLFRAEKADGSNPQLLYEPFLVPSPIVVYRSTWYTSGHSSGCVNSGTQKNGGCSNLCLPTSNGHVCACPDTQRLMDDGKNCLSDIVAVGPDLIWVEHDNLKTSYVRGMHGDPKEYLGERRFGKQWSIRSPQWHWSAVDNDYRKNLLYLADREDSLIVQLELRGNLSIDVIHYGTSSQVTGVAIDWLAGNVYWTDSLFNWIMIAKAEPNTPLTKTLIAEDLDKPHGIAVWPQEGLLLWTDWGVVNKIEKSTLAGENRQILVSSDLTDPMGITIDTDHTKIYWSNRDSIESINADGTGRTKLAEDNLAQFVSLTSFGDFLFATDQDSSRSDFKLWIVNTADPQIRYPKVRLNRKPYGITMFSNEKQNRINSTCLNLGCDQLCVTAANQLAQCLCKDGSILQEDGKTCQENKKQFHGPSFIYSLGDRICSVSAQKAMGFVVDPDTNCFFVDSRYKFQALDYHYSSGYIYFSEVKYRVPSIRRAHMNNMTDNKAVIQGTGDIKGLAVDYVAGNLYWTDSDNGQVWVSRLDGSWQKILISGLLNPHGIVLDQMMKKMYWSEQGNFTDGNATIPGMIKRANMDGTNIIRLNLNGVKKPGGLSLDSVSRRLYWVDEVKASIESISLDGLDNHHVLALPEQPSNGIPALYDVAVYQDFLAYSQAGPSNESGIHLIEKDTSREIASNLKHLMKNQAYDVIVFSKQYQANMYIDDISNSCLDDNGGCEQLCLQRPQGLTCACVDGMRPSDPDHTKCQPNNLLHDNFFLLADDYRYQLYQLSPDVLTSPISALQTPSSDRPIALAYDFTEEVVYWSDFNEGVIRRSKLDGGDVQTIYTGTTGSRIDGLAFDVESRLLYYTDTGLNYIGVLSSTGEHHAIISSDDLPSPRAIVLDSKLGHMYYTVRDTSKGRIERRDMAGRNPEVLIDESISWPNGLDIDFESQQMYWIDAHKEMIESSDIYGNDRITIFEDSSESDPFGLTIQGEYIYWTDWTYKGVFRIRRDGRNKTVVHESVFRGLNDIKFFNKTALRGRNSCSGNNGGCSHFCLAVPNTRMCGCPVGHQIGEDGTTCQAVDTCIQEIPNGRIDPACSRIYNVSCGFVCNAGYTPTVRQNITCTQDMTWSLSTDNLCVERVCPVLPTPEHSSVNPACPLIAYPGVTCYHSCHYLYKTVGGDTSRTCTDSLVWTGSTLVCQQIKCPALNTDSWSNVQLHPAACNDQSAPPGEQCAQSCDSGLLLAGGSSVLVCLDNGSWNGTLSKCIRASEVTTTTASDGNINALNESDPEVTTPMIIGIAVACVALIIIIVLVAVLITRKRAKKMAQYRDSPNLNHSQSTQSSEFHYPGNGNSPTYDAKSNRVDLQGNAMCFSNPGFEATTENPDDSQQANGINGAGALPDKPKLETQVNKEPDMIEFDNPLYTKDKEKKAQVAAVDKILKGEQMPLDLTRELTNV